MVGMTSPRRGGRSSTQQSLLGRDPSPWLSRYPALATNELLARVAPLAAYLHHDGLLARYVRNKRLADALHRQAFCALSGSPGARAYYDALRERDIGYNAALRQLGNRLVGILHGCLKTHPLRRGGRLEPAHSTGSSLTSQPMGCLSSLRVRTITGITLVSGRPLIADEDVYCGREPEPRGSGTDPRGASHGKVSDRPRSGHP